jgi:hypothetical protein
MLTEEIVNAQRLVRTDAYGRHYLNHNTVLLQITDIGRDGRNLRFRQAVRDRFHNS